MAPKRRIGFEVGLAADDGSASEIDGAGDSVTDTSIVRFGGKSLKSDLTYASIYFTATSAVRYSFCVWFYMASFTPDVVSATNARAIVSFLHFASGDGVALAISGEQKAQLWNRVGTPARIGSDGPVITTGVWHRLDLVYEIDTASTSDFVEAFLDDVSFASLSGAITNNLPGEVDLFYNNNELGTGWPSYVGYFDDAALNDDTGASETGRPAGGHMVILLPTADSAVGTGWVDGDGAGTLFGSVNNTPPVGAATPADGTQIKNATSTATGDYDATMETYAAKGIRGTDTIVCVQAVCAHAEAVATGTKAGALQIVSNPAQAAEDGFTYGDDSGVMGAWNANWRHKHGTAQVAPAVTVTTAPVLRVGKRTATNREVDVCFMGIYVEFKRPEWGLDSGGRMGSGYRSGLMTGGRM